MDMERRKFKRFDAFMSVKMRRPEDTNFREVSLSSDLSREGIKVSTSAPVKEGVVVDLEIEIPDDARPVYTTGEVVWIQNTSKNQKDFELGIKFVMMDPVDRFRVLDYAYNNWLDSKMHELQGPDKIVDD